MKVYLSKNEKVFGPYSIAQIRQYIEVGNFALSDKACQDGLNWFTLADAPCARASPHRRAARGRRPPRRRNREEGAHQATSTGRARLR